MKSVLKSGLMIFETIRTFILVIYHFIIWTFTNRISLTIMMIAVIGTMSWGVGFLLFVKNIDQTRAEMISDTPEFSSVTDAIVVLTGGSERMRNALFLLNLGYAQKLFISGVHKEVKLNELLFLHGYTPAQQLAMKSKITMGYSALDTIQNADETAEWVKKNNINSIRLVTSNYHIKRAMLEMQHVLPDTKIIPHGVVPLNIRIDKWWKFKPTRDLLVLEYDKYLLANLGIFLESFSSLKVRH